MLPEDRKKAFLLFAFLFLVIAAFWIQKPLRTSGLLFTGGITALPWAKMLVAAAVLPALALYAALTRRLRTRPRAVLVGVCAGVFALGLGAFAVHGRGSAAAALAYFLFVDLYATVMVALSWSLAHESTPPEQARRIYAFVGLGGILGGMAGSALTGWLAPKAPPGVLLWTAALLLLPLPLLARALGPPAPGLENGRGPSLKAAWDGARLTWASAYLLAIAGVVVFYEMSSNIVDYQFNALALASFRDEAALASFLGRLNVFIIAASVVFQWTLTGRLLRRRGLQDGLLVLPAALMAGSIVFLLVPTLAAATLLFFSDGSLHYSVNQTSKEALYTPTGFQAKYEAKAFIDMFLFRFAKAFSALLIVGFNVWLLPRGWPVHALTGVTLLCLVFWLPTASWAGRRFARLAKPVLLLALLHGSAAAADAERLLGLPGKVLELPWLPVGRALDFTQRTALFKRAEDLFFFNESRTAGWFPNLDSTGSGRGAGLLFYHDDLRGQGRRADAGFTVAGDEQFFGRLRYAGPEAARRRGGAELDYVRDDDIELYAGPGARLGWASPGSPRLSFALTRLRGRVWGRRRLGRLRAGLFAGAQNSKAGPGRADLEQPSGLAGLSRSLFLAGGGLGLEWDAAPGGARAVSGGRAAAELEAQGVGESEHGYLREAVEGSLYLPLPAPHRTILLAGSWERLRPLGAGRAPFYAYPVLDSDHRLRGFKRNRFRAPGAAAVSAEYRYPVWVYWDAFYFIDAAQSFERAAELVPRRFSVGHGPGLRFLSKQRLLLLAQIGFSREGRRVDVAVGRVF